MAVASAEETSTVNGRQFPRTRALGAHGNSAANQFQVVCDRLRQAGAPHAAERLIAMDGSVGDLPFEDLTRLAGPERAADELGTAQQKTVRRLHAARNALALIPLLITWLALGWAGVLYRGELAAHPALGTKPFLLLWENRFGGQTIPTFSETALADLILLTMVLGITVWVHSAETTAARRQDALITSMEEAMSALAVAISRGTVRTPASAEEWASAAQRIISDAMRQAEQLANTSRDALEKASAALAQIHAEGKEFIADLARESLATLVGVREENKQLIAQTAADGRDVLQQAATANRQLIEQQMNPLIGQLGTTLAEFARHHETYRTGVSELSGGVTKLGAAADVLAGSASAYTATAKSIDDHLRVIRTSQDDFTARVNESVTSMVTASTAMRGVSEVLREDLSDDLKKIAKNVQDASAQLVKADRSLAATGSGLNGSASALEDASRELGAISTALGHGSGKRSWWQRLFG